MNDESEFNVMNEVKCDECQGNLMRWTKWNVMKVQQLLCDEWREMQWMASYYNVMNEVKLSEMWWIPNNCV